MDKLKQLFPLSFRGTEMKDMIVSVILYIVVAAIASVLIWVVALIPIVNLVVGIVGTLVDIYVLVGIVLAVLNYFNVLK